MRRPVGSWLAIASAVVWGVAAAHTAHAAIEVQARVSRRTLSVGETSSLDVIVRGAVTGVREPEFDVPTGISVLGTSRTQSFSAVNGQVGLQIVYRYELGAGTAGQYRLGPIRVRVGSQTYESPAVMLQVTSVRGALGAQAGSEPASMVVDVSPSDPYIGQPVVMRVRLVQRATLAEDPNYTPPATAGFWSERASQPESYYADQGMSRVLVTETRTRLYPLAAGDITIGEATATLVIAAPGGGGIDPMQWLGGRAPRREMVVRSQPVHVRVRPLPGGAPASFQGAVGTVNASWSADRSRTPLDVPVTAKLELRGAGNLPLMRTPALVSRDFEQFASTVEDSMPAPGGSGNGARRFQWTVLPRHQGRLELAPPDFSWFDPRDGQYHQLDVDPIALQVGPSQSLASGGDEAFPGAFTATPLDPFRRRAEPWAYAVAGLALGGAFRLLRRASRPPPDQADRAQQRQWMHAVGRGMGTDFWSAADRACEWLERRGHSITVLRRQIESSRYGGTRANAEIVQRELMTLLRASVPAAPPSWTMRVAGAALAAAAVFLMFLAGPRAGDERAVARARAADRVAREGDIDKARAQWQALWREGSRAPDLAARLAWGELRAGAIAPASLWALRGDLEEPRDPSLHWVTGKIRETGGLTGFSSARLPVRRLEWAVLALIAGAIVMVAWPPRWPVAGGAVTVPALGLAVTLFASLIYPAQGAIADRSARAVVMSEVELEGSSIALEPGQVVTLIEREGKRARAVAGAGITGWVPASAVTSVGPG